MFSFFKKHEEEVVAVFDIGNGSLGVAYVALSDSGTPTILVSHREPISFLKDLTSERLIANMLKLLKSVSLHAFKKYGKPVRHAYCFYASPWYVAQTKVLKVEEQRNLLITKNSIESLIKKEEAEFQAALKDGSYEQMFGKDAKLMERRIIHTRLNGYQVENPYNKRAKDIEISFFSSFISKSIAEKVEDIIHTSLHTYQVHHGSYALAAWSALRDIHHHIDDFLFLDISNEITDIVISAQGVLSQTVSFPSGRGALLRAMVKALNIPAEVAQSFLSLYEKNAIEQKSRAIIEKVIAETMQSWKQSLQAALSEIAESHPLPRQVFVTVDSDVASFFAEAMKDSSRDVLVIDESSLASYIHAEEQIHFDPFVNVESIFLNKIKVQ